MVRALGILSACLLLAVFVLGYSAKHLWDRLETANADKSRLETELEQMRQEAERLGAALESREAENAGIRRERDAARRSVAQAVRNDAAAKEWSETALPDYARAVLAGGRDGTDGTDDDGVRP